MSAQVFNLEAADRGIRADGTLGRWLAERQARQARKAGPGNLVLSSDIQGMRDLFDPVPTSSGYPVTDYSAMLVSTLYACLSKISGAVLQLPCHEYQHAAGGDRERVLPATPLWWMLNEQPGPLWTAAAWKEWIVKCVHLRGDQHTEILRSTAPNQGGKPSGLLPHHPDCVKPRWYVLDDQARLAYDVYDPLRDRAYTLDQDDMLHFSGFGFDGRRSLSVVQYAARNALGNELAASDFMGKSIGQGAMPKIALSYPNKIDAPQQKLLRDSFVSVYGSGPTQQRLPLVLTEGGTAAALSISPIDMELLDSRKLSRDQICEATGVPLILVGATEKNTSWGVGIEQVVLGFVKFTLQPHLCRWAEELNRKLYRRAGRYVEFELDALLAGDSKAQAEAFRYALGGPGTGDGWMSVNEVRRLKNLPAQAGAEYDAPFRAQRGTDQPSANQAAA